MSLEKYVLGCVSLKKYKSQGKADEMTVNSKEENSVDFCLDFAQEFGLRIHNCAYANSTVIFVCWIKFLRACFTS